MGMSTNSTDRRLFLPAGARGNTIHGYNLPDHLAAGTRINGPHIAAQDPRQVHAALGWPTRVFEIGDWTGRGPAGSVTGFRVVEELPSHTVLGPHGRTVAALIEHATPDGAPLNVLEMAEIDALYQAVREAGMTAAACIIAQATLHDERTALCALRAALGAAS